MAKEIVQDSQPKRSYAWSENQQTSLLVFLIFPKRKIYKMRGEKMTGAPSCTTELGERQTSLYYNIELYKDILLHNTPS